jgi:hypothetical protein
MTNMTRCTIVLAALAMTPIPGNAQTSPMDTIALGSRVRVSVADTPTRQVTGILAERSADSLIVIVSPSSPRNERLREAVPRAAITMLEVHQSSRRSNTQIGAYAGALLGAMLSLDAAQHSGPAGAGVLLFGVLMGGASGAIIASRIPGRWEHVP